VIDLVCFRKLGHNEQDEPLVTQPFMYRLSTSTPHPRAVREAIGGAGRGRAGGADA